VPFAEVGYSNVGRMFSLHTAPSSSPSTSPSCSPVISWNIRSLRVKRDLLLLVRYLVIIMWLTLVNLYRGTLVRVGNSIHLRVNRRFRHCSYYICNPYESYYKADLHLYSSSSTHIAYTFLIHLALRYLRLLNRYIKNLSTFYCKVSNYYNLYVPKCNLYVPKICSRFYINNSITI